METHRNSNPLPLLRRVDVRRLLLLLLLLLMLLFSHGGCPRVVGRGVVEAPFVMIAQIRRVGAVI